ncbi:hypothetical protein MBRA_02477 [Methylobacterium brachiatum]|nr:hypothetical protein MBRA_02477 [Methylobacterium brachiatum]
MTATVEVSPWCDDDLVKVSTRLPRGLARAMRISARQQDIKIEAAYREAATAYLQKNG